MGNFESEIRVDAMEKINNYPFISVIIPAKNEAQYIGHCLHAIFSSDYPKKNYEVTVVDNGSTDSTLQIATSLGAQVIESKQIGAAASRNFGAKKARGTILAFIDADCVVHKDWLLTMSQYLQRTDVVAVATRAIPSAFNQTWVESASYNLWIKRKGTKLEPVTIVDWIGTSNLMVERTTFERIGGFSEDLVTCEDYDLSQRISKHGNMLMVETIETIHLREPKTLIDFFRREVWRGTYSLRNWHKHRYDIREAASIIAPALFLCSLVLTLILLMSYRDFAILCGLILFFLPSVHLIRSGLSEKSVWGIGKEFAVAFTYLFARSTALAFEVISLLRRVT